MVKAAAIYARISNDPEGERLGVDRQTADCRAEAARRGWPVADVYVDDDKSAWSGKVRPEYERLLADITARRVDAVLFYHPDRLTRRPIELEQFVDVCLRAKLDHIAWIGGEFLVTDSDGLLLLRVSAAVASDSSAKTSKRIRRANDELARAGKPRSGGYRPFGYRDDRLHIDPAEAAYIRDAADRIIAGEALHAIAAEWNAHGITSPAGKPWSLFALRRMITSARLSGRLEHRGEIVAQGVWEPILTIEQAEAITAALAANRYARRRPTRRYFLTGLLRCGRCGASLISRPQSDGARRYVCAKDVGQVGCGRLAVNADEVESFIADAIVLRLDTPELAAALADTAEAGAATADRVSLVEDEAQLEALAREHGRKRITLAEWLAARDEIEARMEEARKRLSRLSRSAAIDPFVGHAGELQKAWPTMDLNRQRTIAASLIDRAVVQPAVPGRARFDPRRIEPVWRV